MFIVLTDFTMNFMQWPYNDPINFWFQGGTMLVFAITTLLALFIKWEWERIQLFFFLIIIWVIMVLIMDIVAVATLNLPATPFMSMIIFILLLTFNLVIGLASWMTQRS